MPIVYEYVVWLYKFLYVYFVIWPLFCFLKEIAVMYVSPFRFPSDLSRCNLRMYVYMYLFSLSSNVRRNVSVTHVNTF